MISRRHFWKSSAMAGPAAMAAVENLAAASGPIPSPAQKSYRMNREIPVEDELEEVSERVFQREAEITVHLQTKEAEAVRRMAESRGVADSELIRQSDRFLLPVEPPPAASVSAPPVVRGAHWRRATRIPGDRRHAPRRPGTMLRVSCSLLTTAGKRWPPATVPWKAGFYAWRLPAG